MVACRDSGVWIFASRSNVSHCLHVLVRIEVKDLKSPLRSITEITDSCIIGKDKVNLRVSYCWKITYRVGFDQSI